jgi:hypothetical protein
MFVGQDLCSKFLLWFRFSILLVILDSPLSFFVSVQAVPSCLFPSIFEVGEGYHERGCIPHRHPFSDIQARTDTPVQNVGKSLEEIRLILQIERCRMDMNAYAVASFHVFRPLRFAYLRADGRLDEKTPKFGPLRNMLKDSDLTENRLLNACESTLFPLR